MRENEPERACETGFAVEPEKPQQVAEAIKKLLLDPDMCQQFGVAGAHHAREQFAKHVTAKSLRRFLVSHGLVRFDSSLAKKDSALWFGYLKQGMKRCMRLLRFRRKIRDKDFDLAEFTK